MSWWLWMLAGAVLTVLALSSLIYLMSVANRSAVTDRQQVAHEQFLAELALQRQLQRTVNELFAAARRGQQ